MYIDCVLMYIDDILPAMGSNYVTTGSVAVMRITPLRFQRPWSVAGGCTKPALVEYWHSQEMLNDTEQKIARPRQIWTGHEVREFVPLARRTAAASRR